MPKQNAMLVLSVSGLVTVMLTLWGFIAPDSLVAFASKIVDQYFETRGWFVMLTISFILFLCAYLAFSKFGKIKLGEETDEPEFSTTSWIAMLFAAGMGVGLLYWASAEPLSHYNFTKEYVEQPIATQAALEVTLFNWGIHAWAIYAIFALVIAFFSFRHGMPMLMSSPVYFVFGDRKWAPFVGNFFDICAVIATAIGVGGSVAMGVFQVATGISIFLGWVAVSVYLLGAVLVAIIAGYMPALLVDLGSGMARLSNLAMSIAIALVCYVLILGPTQYLLNSIVTGFGEYMVNFIPQGFQTYVFFDDAVSTWFADWTLIYMLWWIAWGPFVGVFIARISRGRTIREFLLAVCLVPAAFSLVWFGTFGGIGFFEAFKGDGELLGVVETNLDAVTFALLDRLPLSSLTSLAVIIAGFLFLITSAVSACFVMGTFISSGDVNPSTRSQLICGALLAVLSAVMVLTNSINVVRTIIALGALPFVFITLSLILCLMCQLKEESHANG